MAEQEVDFDPFGAKADGKPASKPDKGIGELRLPKPVRMIDAGVRGAADFLTMGFADELAAGAGAVPGLLDGSFSERYDRNLAQERGRDAADKRDVPVSRGVGQGAGFLAGLGAGAITNLGRFVPRMVGNPGILHGLESVGRGMTAGAAYGGLGAAGNADGSPMERGQAAIPGAMVGGMFGGAAVPIGSAIGAGVRGVGRLMTGRDGVQRGVDALRSKLADADVPGMRQRLQELGDAGAEGLTLVDALDENGRMIVGAAASRMTPAREAARDFADARRYDLPNRMSEQARRTMSADPRTPGQIAEDLGRARGQAADTAFSAVRGDAISMAPETVQALRTPHARAAIAEAVRRERDPDVRAALGRLVDDALDNPSTQITVGMADRISRVLASQAQAAARAGDNDLAATLGGLARDIRNPARAASPGYGAALDEYAEQSRIMEAAERGEDFLQRNTDEFVTDAANMSPEERAVALATGRRAIERKAGENVSAAPGVARAIALAPEQQARNAALLGPEGADQLQRGMAAEERLVQNAQDINPRSGSPTQPRKIAADVIDGITQVGAAQAAGPLGWLGLVATRLKTLGMSDADAEVLVRMAIDENSTDRALNLLAARIGPQDAAGVVSAIRQVASRNAGEATAPPAVYVERVGEQAFDPWGNPIN